MLLGHIRPLWFFAAFAFGLLACYVLQPKPEVVVRFPSPYNAGKVVYRGVMNVNSWKVKAAAAGLVTVENPTLTSPGKPEKATQV